MSCTAAGALAASAAGLTVSVSAPTSVVIGDVDVMVNVTVSNPTSSAISVLRWELPGDARDAASFRILRNGEPVTYMGRLIKRAAPTAADYYSIQPGATLNYTVELTGAYDLAKDGTYTIEYTGAGVSGEASTASLRSVAPASVWLVSRSGRGAYKPAAVAAAVAPGTDAISYSGNCSASQQTALATAVNDAATYAQGALNYFANSRLAGQRFTKWFGPGSRSSWNYARGHYVKILDALVNKPVTLDCSCNQAGVYAYVYPALPYTIYVCSPVYFQAPATGTDSKAGTLIHEMSHFTVVAGTDDYAYGQTAAAALAINNPSQALNNADSHEYFAENTPALP
jgi:peptidyl-Lys metalloendopeptidase